MTPCTVSLSDVPDNALEYQIEDCPGARLPQSITGEWGLMPTCPWFGKDMV